MRTMEGGGGGGSFQNTLAILCGWREKIYLLIWTLPVTFISPQKPLPQLSLSIPSLPLPPPPSPRPCGAPRQARLMDRELPTSQGLRPEPEVEQGATTAPKPEPPHLSCPHAQWGVGAGRAGTIVGTCQVL